MCNLYRMTKTISEVGDWFGTQPVSGGANFGSEVFPGYPGLVLTADEQGVSQNQATQNQMALQQMIWGFPLILTGKQGQKLKPKPVNNARLDKLDSYFWRDSFQKRRCLIPLSAWAEAEGRKGAKTRTWLSLEGQELLGVAGVWRKSDEWGACFSMVMTDSAGPVEQVHARMPVVLAPKDYGSWLNGEGEAAKALCIPQTVAQAGNVQIDRTSDGWSRGSQRGLF